ncbi:MAG: hypothetical protein SH847_04770 [Roseiflexaceae bacterium]|nr:hypothetical protein [Roseiflexaceae bacterium]
MIRLLSPGMMLLNRLRYPQKFLLVSLLLVLPLILAIGLLLSETMPRIEFTNRELAGARYIEQLRNLMVQVDESHVLVDEGQSEQMLAHQPTIAASLAAVRNDAVLDTLFSTRSALLPIQELHQSLQQAMARNDREAIDQGHIAMISSLREEIRRVGDTSNLILDPELTTYYLMDTAVVQAPSRAVLLLNVDHTIDRPTTSANVSFELSVLAGQLAGNVDATRNGLQVALAHDAKLDGELTAVLADSLTSATALTEALRATGKSGLLNTEQTRALSSDAFQSNMRLWRSSLIALNTRLQQRIDLLWQKNLLAGGVAIVLLFCVIYLLIAFYRSMMHTVAALDLASRQIAAGTQSTEVQIETHDELGQVAQTLIRAVQGARLLGSGVVLAGVRAEVATTIVHLGVDLSTVAIYATLQEALDAHRLGTLQQ